MLVDTHCHIHQADYPLDPEMALARAHAAGVDKIICVGVNEQSSLEAINFASRHYETFASLGVHPHDSSSSLSKLTAILNNKPDKLVAIGEIGLDYFYMSSPKQVQITALESQIQLALNYNLPIIFHVRKAFEDFWPILDNFHGFSGVLHSFSDSLTNMEKGLERRLYIGLNGISTFTKSKTQQETFLKIPLESLLLETDAPFLTPAPYRDKVNEPAFVKIVAEHQAKLRGVSFDIIAKNTTANAQALFGL